MTKLEKILAVTSVALLGGVVALLVTNRSTTPVPEAETPAPMSEKAEPMVRFPLPTGDEKPLPTLEDSDGAMQSEFDALFDRQKYGPLFVLKEIINRVVVTIDNLHQRNLPWSQLIFTSMKGELRVKKIGMTSYVLDAENYKRYKPFIEMVDAVDVSKLVAVYFRYYALFQESYRNLGYPKAYFNDRVIANIDHLLAVPDVENFVALKRPSVYYVFAEAKLENLSSGQKVLIRMGPENAAKVKAKLREIKQEILAQIDKAAESKTE